MDGDLAVRTKSEDLTRTLAEQASAVSYDALPEAVRELARQCVLDYYGVALAGADDKLAAILLDELAEAGGAAQASVIGHRARLPALSAALVNGAIGHALDYDDVNLAMPGHPSVAILPALLALAEQRHSSGREVIAAFVAGYETACRIGTGAQARPLQSRLPCHRNGRRFRRRGGLRPPPRARRRSHGAARSASPGPRRPGSNRNSARCASRSTPARRRRTGCWRRASPRAAFRAGPTSSNASRVSR